MKTLSIVSARRPLIIDDISEATAHRERQPMLDAS
jgi:hypothetical protein